MIRSLLPYFFTAVAAVMLRDLECYLAAKIFCWRKRRQSQREAQQNRELRRLADELAAAEKADEEQKKKDARIAKLMAAVPYPRLLNGPRVITIRTDKDFLLVTKCLHANFVAQGKSIVNANFENN